MKRFGALVAAAALLLGFAATPDAAQAASGKTFYWLSHSSSTDPFWISAVAGANQAAKDLGVTVHTSFANSDVAVEKENFQAAIAAGATGIAVSSPKDGALKAEVAAALAKHIPVVFFNSDDPATGRAAYVGANLKAAGVMWAQYLVDKKLVKKGNTVWLPVEAPGATYQTEETSGISSVFTPLGIKYKVFNASADPAKSLSNMTDYLTVNKSKVNAIIGLGDMVMGNIQKAFTTARIKPGSIPVVGWGNTNETAKAVLAGYVKAALWQFPESQGYEPIVLLNQASEGMAIGFDITTSALYDKSNAKRFADATAKK